MQFRDQSRRPGFQNQELQTKTVQEHEVITTTGPVCPPYFQTELGKVQLLTFIPALLRTTVLKLGVPSWRLDLLLPPEMLSVPQNQGLTFLHS